MDTVSLLKKVKKIEITTKAVIKDLFAGDYHSAFKGRGMSFSEVREYSHGDDIRHIDWNVTARSSHPFVKVFEEERELTLLLLIDVSPSSKFGSSILKSDLIAEICAVLAFSALRNQDKVGAVFFTDKIEKYIPPKKGKQNILHVIREIIQINPQGNGTNISTALEFLNNVHKKKTICFIVSDFMDQNFEKSITTSGKKHDIIGMHIYDEREKHLPNVGIMEVMDPESKQIQIIDSSSATVRQFFLSAFENHLEALQKTFSRSQVDLISLSTGEKYISSLHSFFKKRAKR
ncbi:MAG: DUF58 domain-containing protein [Saprospiraceae bacterium]